MSDQTPATLIDALHKVISLAADIDLGDIEMISRTVGKNGGVTILRTGSIRLTCRSVPPSNQVNVSIGRVSEADHMMAIAFEIAQPVCRMRDALALARYVRLTLVPHTGQRVVKQKLELWEMSRAFDLVIGTNDASSLDPAGVVWALNNGQGQQIRFRHARMGRTTPQPMECAMSTDSLAVLDKIGVWAGPQADIRIKPDIQADDPSTNWVAEFSDAYESFYDPASDTSVINRMQALRKLTDLLDA